MLLASSELRPIKLLCPQQHTIPPLPLILICLSLETWMDLLFSLGGTQVVDADFRRFNGELLFEYAVGMEGGASIRSYAPDARRCLWLA